MRKLLNLLPAIGILFSSCSKTEIPVNEECIIQNANPASNSYFEGDLLSINYSGIHCGMMPLSSGNYWVYEDSVFDNTGSFRNTKLDTLRYTKTYQSPDKLIWWEGTKNVGLPPKIYSSGIAVFGLQRGMFIADSFYSKREFFEAESDSVSFLSGFGDIIAFGKIIRKTEMIVTAAGSFTNYILFEKYAPGYRRDRVYFVPGFGVIKYTNELYKAPGPPTNMRLQLKSELAGFHSSN